MSTKTMSTIVPPPDIIIINKLRVQAIVGPDRWAKVRQQPITFSVHIETPLVAAGNSDNVADSVHYGDLAKDLAKHTDDVTFDSLHTLARFVAGLVLARDERIVGVEVAADAGNQFLQAESLGVQVRRTRGEGVLVPDRTLMKDLSVSTIIGVNAPERAEKQVVLVNLTFYSFDWSKADWKTTHATLVQAIEASSYLTLETFVVGVARVACSIDGADTVTVRAQKPSALATAHSSGVEITRSRAFFNL